MATIGGGGYFNAAMINSELMAKGPDAQQSEAARSAAGGKADQAKFNKADESHTHSDGVHLSSKARAAAQPEQHHLNNQEAAELADQLGLNQDAHKDEDGQIESRNEYNRERNLGMGEDEEAKHTIIGSNGVEQSLDDNQAQRLQIVDDEDHGLHLNGDVPQANLEAAEKIFNAQATQGLKKVAELKPVPEAQQAGAVDTRIVGFESEPMDIADATGSRYQPMSLELPPETHEIAKEMAAHQLASGQLDEQMLAG